MLSGSNVSNNSANEGGGINNNRGIFNMEEGALVTGNNAVFGGGVMNIGLEAVFNMLGGNITGNVAQRGGGVLNAMMSANPSDSDTVFKMRGGEISGNTATVSGGGIENLGLGIFLISKGVIYGTNDPANSNTAPQGAVLLNGEDAIAQSGTFGVDGQFTKTGDLDSTNLTIRLE